MRPAPTRWILVTASLLLAAAEETRGIEMFTFFGDGSRIGLPSLEVPIEAYPGIPLRSDRLRARRRAMRLGSATTGHAGPPSASRGITIRALPSEALSSRQMPRPAPVEPDEDPVPPEPAVEAIPAGPASR